MHSELDRKHGIGSFRNDEIRLSKENTQCCIASHIAHFLLYSRLYSRCCEGDSREFSARVNITSNELGSLNPEFVRGSGTFDVTIIIELFDNDRSSFQHRLSLLNLVDGFVSFCT